MEKKTTDHGPTAYGWGIFIGSMITLCMCRYYPEDASWWQDLLLGLGIGFIILIIPVIWLPSPEKTEKDRKES